MFSHVLNMVIILLIFIPLSLFLFFVNLGYSRHHDIEPISPVRWLACFLVPMYISFWGLSRKSLSVSGAIAGFIVGFVHTLSSNCFFASLLAFFVSTSKATKFRASQKAKFEEHFKEGGQRNWVQVLCNGGVSTQLAILYVIDNGTKEQIIDFRQSYNSSWLAMAVLGAICCSAGDTFSSEIGSVMHTNGPWLITTLSRVPRGTNGGITFWGTLASFVGGAIVGFGYYITLLLSVESELLKDCPPQWLIVVVCGLAGLVGSTIDSLLGSTFQFSGFDKETKHIVEKDGPNVETISGMPILDNHSVNLLASFLTSLITPRLAYTAYWHIYLAHEVG